MRGTTRTPHAFLMIGNELFLILGRTVEDNIDDYAKDQGTGNLRKRDGTDVHCHPADSCNQDYGSCEQVAVIVQVYGLKHLQTGNGDEAVESNAYAAHHTGGDRAQESDERSAEAGSD